MFQVIGLHQSQRFYAGVTIKRDKRSSDEVLNSKCKSYNFPKNLKLFVAQPFMLQY